MYISIGKTARRMNQSLLDQAEKHIIGLNHIEVLFEDYDIDGLDDLFGDNGKVRCEYFGDLAFEYALQFGELGSEAFEEARWEVTQLAMDTFEDRDYR